MTTHSYNLLKKNDRKIEVHIFWKRTVTANRKKLSSDTSFDGILLGNFINFVNFRQIHLF